MILVLPSPLIEEVNASSPVRFNVPSFSIVLVIFKLPASTLTVPELIVKSFCVTSSLKLTSPVVFTAISPVAPITSASNVTSAEPPILRFPVFSNVSPNSVSVVSAFTSTVPLLVIPLPLKPLQADTLFNTNVSSSSIVTPPNSLPSTAKLLPLTVNVALSPSMVSRSLFTSSFADIL